MTTFMYIGLGVLFGLLTWGMGLLIGFCIWWGLT